jgi:phosphoglycolate phosphatase
MKLLLFDIDGTLLLTGGAGQRAMMRAFADTYGIPDALQRVEVAGRTDRIIMRDALALSGQEFDEEGLADFRERYCRLLHEELAVNGNGRRGVLPGVGPLLDALAGRADVTLALLTGNFRDSAEIKLAYFDLWRYFAWGAFGEEAFERHLLLPIALERHRSIAGPIDPGRVIIIGDTPHDVDCAHRGGARALAVATGHYDAATLRACAADAVVDDLTDTSGILRFIDAE